MHLCQSAWLYAYGWGGFTSHLKKVCSIMHLCQSAWPYAHGRMGWFPLLSFRKSVPDHATLLSTSMTIFAFCPHVAAIKACAAFRIFFQGEIPWPMYAYFTFLQAGIIRHVHVCSYSCCRCLACLLMQCPRHNKNAAHLIQFAVHCRRSALLFLSLSLPPHLSQHILLPAH